MSYIPSHQERIKIYNVLRNNQALQDENNFNFPNSQYGRGFGNQGANKKTQCISKEELHNIVDRLSKATRRDYIIKQQVQNLQAINKEKRKRQTEEQRVENRLIKAGKQLQNKKEVMREGQKKKEGQTILSNPKMNIKTKSKIDKPFLERMEEAAVSKQQQLERIRNETKTSFNPELNPYSIFMAEVKNRKKFIERVQQFEEERVRALNQKEKEKQRKELEAATFKPEINEKSKQIGISRINSSISKSKTNKSRKSERQFIPEINKKSVELADRRNSSNTQFHERLYADMKKSSIKKLQIRKQMDTENTFKPRINNNSKKIVEKVKQTSDRFRHDYQEIKFVVEAGQISEDQPLFEGNRRNSPPQQIFEQVLFEKWKPPRELKTRSRKEDKAIQLLSLKLIR